MSIKRRVERLEKALGSDDRRRYLTSLAAWLTRRGMPTTFAELDASIPRWVRCYEDMLRYSMESAARRGTPQ